MTMMMTDGMRVSWTGAVGVSSMSYGVGVARASARRGAMVSVGYSTNGDGYSYNDDSCRR